MGLLVAEIRKLTTVRATWILTALGVAFVALFAAGETFGGLGDAFTGSPEQVGSVVGAIGANSAIPLVVALLAMTTEFRHGTIGRTVQLTPSRTRVLVAKLAAGGTYALVFVALAGIAVLAVLTVGAQRYDASLSFDGQVGEVLWQATVGLVLTALLGVAFGAVVRAQVIAITVALVWIFVIETFVFFQFPSVGRWLPFQALNNLFVGGASTGGAPPGMLDAALEPAAALTTFLAWVIGLSALAIASMRYRDV